MIKLAPLVYRLGCFIRNPSLSTAYEDLKSTEFSDRSSLERLQFNKLKETLVFSYLNSAFYRELFENNGFDPRRDFLDISDLCKVPTVNKSQLIQNNSQIHTIEQFQFKKLFFSETSGSTGQALTFYKDEVWDSYNRASIQRGMSWHGVNPWDYNGYLWGYNIDFISSLKIKTLDFIVNRFRLFKYSERHVLKFLDKCKDVSYLGGYSSMLYELAKVANSKDITFNNIKLIKGTSEKIFPHYQEEVKKAFGVHISSEYGSAESGIIAFECPEGKMHLNEETCYVEVVDKEIIVTNLIARSFPTIRYELGDYIGISDTPCLCGRSHRVLDSVLGRVGANIIGRSNTKYPSLTLYYIFKNMALNHSVNLDYRCVQNLIGELDVYLDKTITAKTRKQLLNEFNKYFMDDISCSIKIVDSIHNKQGKLKDFESRL
jgi:phenylacetate-CoA ligase